MTAPGTSAPRARIAADSARIILDEVSLAYPLPNGARLPVVAGVSLTVKEAEFVALVGPSGCGKSTILRGIAGLLPPERGRILVDAAEVKGPPPHVGFMFQKDTLLPWETVEGNIRMGLHLAGVPRERWRVRTADLLSLLRLEGFGNSFPSQLSGGMRQRVSLGRMLAYEPDVMLMDEPFGALDFLTKIALGRELLRIWEAERRSILFVTHDIEEAVTLADRVVVFSPRPARIIGDHAVDIERPRDIRALRSDPRFGALCRGIWADLGDVH